jgi:hypothetical protein
LILFGPQLVLHTLGQWIRQSLEFTVSGASPEDAKGVNMAFRSTAGPREDRPLDRYPNFLNLRTVVWCVGLFSFGLNLVALTNLDMLNVLLLLPSLLFSISTLVGPFLMTPKAGKRIGKWILLPKILGWVAVVLCYMAISQLTAAGGKWVLGALLLSVAVFGLIIWHGLRYANFRWRLRRAQKQVEHKLAEATRAAKISVNPSPGLADSLLALHGDAKKLAAALGQSGLPETDQKRLLDWFSATIVPQLKGPAAGSQQVPSGKQRFRSAFGRSFVLAAFVLVWFLIVPVPGLFVFTAREYRFSLEFSTIMKAVSWSIVFVLVTYWAGAALQWVQLAGGRRSLRRRFLAAFASFQARLWEPELHRTLAPVETAELYALFTDTQTYVDQYSYAYARQTMETIEAKLNATRSDSAAKRVPE